MSYVFEDTYTLDVKAEWLDLFERYDYFSSPRRQVPHCKNLFWWINFFSYTNNGKYNVYMNVCTSTVSCLIETVTVLLSDVKNQYTEFRSESSRNGCCRIISLINLELGDIIKDGVFSVKVDVKFTIPTATIDTLSKLGLFEDSYTIKLDRKTLGTYKPRKVEQKQKVGGITWWIEHCPNPDVYFHITGGPIRMEYSCAATIDGVQIQKTCCEDFKNFDRCLTLPRKLIQLADHKDGIIDTVCKVKFFKPITEDRIYGEKNPTKTSVNDSITISFLECQLDDNEIGEFDSTPKQFVKDADKHQWRLKCFPAGDSFGGKRHISLFVEASTTETKTVTMSGVIRILGTNFEKKFKTIVENDTSLAFSKLILHEEVRQIGGIVDNQVTIICDATFHTFDFLTFV